jgi:inactive STAND
MDQYDEKSLFGRLETFETYQFIKLRHELGLSSSQVPLADTPQVTAERFINFIKLRDDKDLTKLREAVDVVLSRKSDPITIRAQAHPSREEEIEGELDLDGKLRPPPVSPVDIPKIHLFCDRDDPVQSIRRAFGSSVGAIAFLIVGYEDQSHDLLIDRLNDYELRGQSARADGGQVPVKWVTIPERYPNKEEFKELLEIEIRGDELPVSQSNLSDVAKTLYRKGPVSVVASEMFLGDWKTSGPEKVKAFLEFWKDWPKPMGQERIVVCLNIRIDRREFRERLRYRIKKSPVFMRLERLIAGEQSLLPPDRNFVITGVKKEDAARLRKSEHVRAALSRFSLKSDDLEDNFVQVYKDAARWQWWDSLPTMKRFAQKLETMIQKTIQARGRGRTPV